MFYNIFEKLKLKKKSNFSKTPKIIADIHEKNSLIFSELNENKEIFLEIKSLKIADYLIGEIAIERKTVSDFVNSMINKRLLQQLINMKKYSRRLLIIEGDINEIYEKEDNLSKAIRGFILSIITNSETPVILTKDYKDTSKYLITLAKQQIKTKTEPTFHNKTPETLNEKKQYILESFPNIGPKKAKKLLEKFSTLSKVFNATEEELKEILKNQSKDLKQMLNS